MSEIFVSDATEDLGQYVARKVVCCIIGRETTQQKQDCVFTPVIPGITFAEMEFARSKKVNLFLDTFLNSSSTQLGAYKVLLY